MKWVNLIPHPSTSSELKASFQLRAGAILEHDFLKLRFLLTAERHDFLSLKLSKSAGTGARKNELWKETCFECFVPDSATEAYLEFNGSASGDWNLYFFDSYRLGMKECALLEALPPKLSGVEHREELGELEKLEIEWSIPRSVLPKNSSALGITMVLKTAVGTSYWAVAHTGEKPDFHLRSSFVYDSIRN